MKRKRASCHKFCAKLDKIVARKADSAEIIKMFLLPKASAKNPQKSDVSIIPANQTPLTIPYWVFDVILRSHSATGKAYMTLIVS